MNYNSCSNEKFFGKWTLEKSKNLISNFYTIFQKPKMLMKPEALEKAVEGNNLH